MYGLPKIHKADIPMRPILSAIGTINYELARFLVSVLSPFTKSEYSVSHSFEFAKEISTSSSTNSVMASFDVTSLFTNIPLNETISICLELLYNNRDDPPAIKRADMEVLLNLAAKESVFLFNGDIYKQVDGVAMGSPLGLLWPTSLWHIMRNSGYLSVLQLLSL